MRDTRKNPRKHTVYGHCTMYATALSMCIRTTLCTMLANSRCMPGDRTQKTHRTSSATDFPPLVFLRVFIFWLLGRALGLTLLARASLNRRPSLSDRSPCLRPWCRLFSTRPHPSSLITLFFGYPMAMLYRPGQLLTSLPPAFKSAPHLHASYKVSHHSCPHFIPLLA